ncbi:MAG: protein kinase domain-containing protein [Acidiferrobacter sp.]
MEPHRTGRNERHTPTLEPGRTLGSYLVLSTLSASARSTIYMAQDLALDRPVALKTSPRGTISVIAEGRILARYNHPHIVTLYGLWAQPPTLVLEYLVGETLKARHGRLGVLPDTQVRDWLLAVLSALETIHGHGLAHGAIRSDNIFLTTDQRIKVLDFRQTSLGELPPTPSDDVRAAGRLLQDLLGTEGGVLADIARSALLGRYPTARALRLALAGVSPNDGGELALVAPDTALATTHPVPPETEICGTSADPGFPLESYTQPPNSPYADLAEACEDPVINPILPAFHERPRWGRPVRGHKRLTILLTLLLIAGLLAAQAQWPHRPKNLRPVAQIAHTRGPLGGTPGAPGVPPNPSAAPKTVIHPGAYAALAHAWGG